MSCGTGQLHGVEYCVRCQNLFEPTVQDSVERVDYRFSSLIVKGYRKLLELKMTVEGCSNPQSPDANRLVNSTDGKDWTIPLKMSSDNFNSSRSNMSVCDVYSHLIYIRSEHIHNYVRSLLQRLITHPLNRSTFNKPVDAALLKIPNYHDVIKFPMDLGTIKTKLQALQYAGFDDFFNDCRLVFSNATLFNPPTHPVSVSAKAIAKELEVEVLKLEEKIKKDHDKVEFHFCSVCNGKTCGICGEKCLKLEPPIISCTGGCRTRIKRGAPFYVSADDVVWCQKCYSAIGAHPLEEGNEETRTAQSSVPDQIVKKDLVKRLHDSEIYETMSKCFGCGKMFHEVCVLHNPRSNMPCGSLVCLFCQVKESYALLGKMPLSSFQDDTYGAAILPQCGMSQFLERKIHQKLGELGQQAACATVRVRVISNTMRTFSVQDEIKFFFSKAPNVLSYRSKCIALFQEIDGVDVCLFCMYVQEYENTSTNSNKNVVYIAYLDSVEYFRPRDFRTTVYHELVVAYLCWAGMAGFGKAYIWACPPQRGNSFIFWCHPSHQRTPNKERLLKWYATIVKRAKYLGVVKGSSNLYEEHFKILSTSASRQREHVDFDDCPPIFDGDFWVEQILLISERQHKSLRPNTAEPHAACRKILSKILSHPDASPFSSPVDVIALNIPDYFDIISCPMDLGTVTEKLTGGIYSTVGMFVQDVQLVFDNAMKYNPPNHPIHIMALKLKRLFEKELRTFAFKLKYDDTDDLTFVSTEIKTQHEEEQQACCDLKVKSTVLQLSRAIEKMKEDFLVLHLQSTKETFGRDFPDCRDSPVQTDELPKIADTRQFFLEVCQHNGYQFDTLRRAKFSTMMILCHLTHPELEPVREVQCTGCGIGMAPSSLSNTCTSCSRRL